MSLRDHRPQDSTLLWSGDRQTDRQTGGQERQQAVGETGERSDCEEASRTESERELMVDREKRRPEGEKAGLMGKDLEEEELMKRHLEEEEELMKRHLEEENFLPQKASQVFSPAVSVLHSTSSHRRDSEAFWEMESAKSPFLDHQETTEDHQHFQHGYQQEWDEDTPTSRWGCCCPRRDVLKMGVSLFTSALFFPFLVWGGFIFLPFDAPLLDGAPLRLVYTLRCSVFAAVPIVLGWMVLGFARLRSGRVLPLCDDVKGPELQEVNVHRRFVADSSSLFLMYFLQLVVMTMYLSQEQLKLIPLLTIVFAFGRLVYWVAAAFGSSVRGFGFGLSFLPSVAMMAANIYFIFSLEAGGAFFSPAHRPEELEAPPTLRQRFWG
ncbi:transmembrane protein 79-like isoform X2 [Genypterus blacodes]|uniref:transmembrane protein 79-like isoform X2 n=1 Tax=Genypterus blacodes TaxID=154954 RepID=UPI003F75ED28